jgi:hypothetical protein
MVRGLARQVITPQTWGTTWGVAKYVKLCREALAPIPCGRVVPHSCLVDSLSPKSDGPCLLRRESASSMSGQSSAFLDIT